MQHHSDPRFSTVHLISQKGMPNGTEMCSDLVKPSGVQIDLEQAERSSRLIMKMRHLNDFCLCSLPSIRYKGSATLARQGLLNAPGAGTGRVLLTDAELRLSKLSRLELKLRHVET